MINYPSNIIILTWHQTIYVDPITHTFDLDHGNLNTERHKIENISQIGPKLTKVSFQIKEKLDSKCRIQITALNMLSSLKSEIFHLNFCSFLTNGNSNICYPPCLKSPLDFKCIFILVYEFSVDLVPIFGHFRSSLIILGSFCVPFAFCHPFLRQFCVYFTFTLCSFCSPFSQISNHCAG